MNEIPGGGPIGAAHEAGPHEGGSYAGSALAYLRKHDIETLDMRKCVVLRGELEGWLRWFEDLRSQVEDEKALAELDEAYDHFKGELTLRLMQLKRRTNG